MARAAAQQSGSFMRRKRERLIIASGAGVVAVIALLCGLSWLAGISAFAITSVEVEGADEDIVPAIHAAALEALEGKRLGLFARSNVFLYPSGRIAAAARAASSRVESIEVDARNRHTLVVSVTQKEPAAIVCATLPDFHGSVLALEEAKPCYFAEESGALFGDAPVFSGLAYKRYYAPEAIGLQATSTEEFAALQEFYDGARAAGIEAEAILIKEGGEYELFARNPARGGEAGEDAGDEVPGGSMVIYFNTTRDFSEQLSNLVSFWSSMAQKARSSRDPLAFDYIDVRYGSNVFYREHQ